MILLGKIELQAFTRDHPDLKDDLDSWQAEVEEAEWKTPYEVAAKYPAATFPGRNQVIFKIYWNRFRIWVVINYKVGIVMMRGIGNHKEYDKWPIE